MNQRESIECGPLSKPNIGDDNHRIVDSLEYMIDETQNVKEKEFYRKQNNS